MLFIISRWFIIEAELLVTYSLGQVSYSKVQQNIYENIGEDQDGEDDGWGSSEFEDYEDDCRSIGAQSQNSQEPADRVVNKSKNLFRRKIPARLSWGKPGSDVQSLVRFNYSRPLRNFIFQYI